MAAETFIAPFSPGMVVAGLVGGGAPPTCAVALGEGPISTKNGRPFITNCRLWGQTSGMEVDVADSVVSILFGCSTPAEVKEHVRAQSLTSVRQRLNSVVRATNNSF